MKPTIRVSIGGLAFNLDEDAYKILNNYLEMLKKHFELNPESDEIVTDIEARLSELLQMRLKDMDGVVSVSDAQEIINRMGNPKDFGDQSDIGEPDEANNDKFTDSGKEKEPLGYFKKKLYRDADHRILGGVCSGLGHYFRIDPVAVRILFVAALLLSNFLAFKSVPVVIIAYIVLWIVMPKARTFAQKLAMSGSDPSIENIEDRTYTSQKKYRGSFLSDIVRVLFNIIIGFLAVITFIVLLCIIISLIWLYADVETSGIINYLFLLGLDTITFKTALVLVLTLPFLGMFCLLVKILRRTSFKSRSWVSFSVGLIIWLGAGLYLCQKGVSFARNHRQSAEIINNIPVNTFSDTLYVKLSDEYINSNLQADNNAILYNGETRSTRKVAILPIVTLREDSSLTNFKVEILKKALGQNQFAASRNLNNKHLEYNVTDSLIVLSPQWYTRKDVWNGEIFKVLITVPTSKTVIVESPLSDFYKFNPPGTYRHDNCFIFYNHSYFD